MKTYTAVVERCSTTGYLVGYVPGLPGAYTQAESIEELRENLKEVIKLVLEDGETTAESEFLGTELVEVG